LAALAILMSGGALRIVAWVAEKRWEQSAATANDAHDERMEMAAAALRLEFSSDVFPG